MTTTRWYDGRNQTSHTYDEVIANQIWQLIEHQYHGLFAAFEAKMQQVVAQAE